VVLALVLSSCHRRQGPTSPDSWREGSPRPHLKRLWRLPGLEAPTSVLDFQPLGATLLALGPETRGRRDLVAVDVQRGRVLWHAPLDRWQETALFTVGAWALAADNRGILSGFDLRTGKPEWKTQLDCRFRADEAIEQPQGVLVLPCMRDKFGGDDDGEAILVDLHDGALRGRRSWQRARPPLPSIRAPGDRARSPGDPRWREQGPLCWPQTHDAEFPMFTFGRGRALVRSGRLFWVDCEKVQAVDEPGAVWTPPRMPDFAAPAIVAFDAQGASVQMLLASFGAPGEGRLVVFRGRQPALIADTGTLESQIVSLASGVLVVRRGGVQAEVGQALGLFPSQATALEGYSVSEAEGVDEEPGAAERDHLRRLVQAGGRFERRACETGVTRFDQVTFGAVLAIPNWEDFIPALLADRDEHVQDGALAAAVEARSPRLAGVLVQALHDLAKPFPRMAEMLRAQEDVWRGREETGWYEEAASAMQSRRIRLASALLMTDSPDAISVLGPLLLEEPELGYDYVPGCSTLIPAICRALAGSPRADAAAALAAYDRKVDVPGAWRVLCNRH